MDYKNNLELSIYLRSFGTFDTKIISAIEETPIKLFKNEIINNIKSTKINLKKKIDMQFYYAYLSAVIAQKLQLKSHENILEIGTGSGYFTAVFSRLSRKVYTIEKFKTFYVLANNNFKKLKLTNIKSRCEDGLSGWIEEAPFDKVLISGVIDQVNDNLIKQIKINGKFICSTLSSSGVHILQLFKVDKNKSLSKIEDICEYNIDHLNKF